MFAAASAELRVPALSEDIAWAILAFGGIRQWPVSSLRA